MDLLFLEKLLVGLFASVLVAVAVSKLRGRKLRLPPGPVPVPIFGNWLQVGDDLNHRNLAALARRFGEIFLLRMGQRNVVVVSSPALAREVLHARGAEFGSRGRNVVFDVFTDGGQDMVFAAYGDHWRTMRRVGKVVQRHHAGWEAEAAAVLMMYNNMYSLMFGRRFEGLDDPLLLRLRELNGERSRLAQSFEYNYGDFIPVLRPFLRGYLKICKEVKDARLKLYKDCFVEERRKMLASGKATDSHELKCGMDEILEAQRKGEINEDHVLFIVENINVADDAVGNGVGGGRVNHPETQQKLRREMDRVLGAGHQVTEPDTHRLP
ncbi:LOW QUALITY PROTEIN: hypothetical protein CFC21_023773 [Triticum aestivum]|uniref:trans-cinnamate 4-monooxygenase n=2 Tax=Triticum aestivum TaxID=4565 RepID=A0A3B6C7C7_WHEAT|nr:LOW QUALITY PROTEIN: hypothetical protein CFC21_023773 [Triticum aestivum]